jgi:splicing factor 3A subunit 1
VLAPTSGQYLKRPHTPNHAPRAQDTIGDLKSRLEPVTGLALNKQRLQREGVGFLSDELSLAHYNVSADVVLTLSTKTRGRKK